jgi:predicted dehydrogenase
MPNLTDLQDEFEVTAVCDISAGAANYIAKRFHVPLAVTDYRDLLAADVEAVLLCQSDPKTDVAVAALDAGKHLFIEKPICFSLEEADAIIAARARAGTVGQAGYMKVYDPAFELAKEAVAQMEAIRFVQINHLHPNNALHLQQFHLERFDDIPPEAGEAMRMARAKARQQAIGEVSPAVEGAFYLLAGSMIHDLYTLRTMMGVPQRVVSTEIWEEGRAVTITFEYANDARCVATWVDLPNLWDFKETLEIYGDNQRVLVSYPTGFARGILSTVTIRGSDPNGRAYRQEPAVDWESAFRRELRHFHDCIVNGTPCYTSVESARHDIALIIDIIKRYLD